MGMVLDDDDITLKLSDDWSIIQWRGTSGRTHWDIWHCIESLARCSEVVTKCACGKEVPESVQGFLVLCRNKTLEA